MEIKKEDKFIVLASDGIWENLTNVDVKKIFSKKYLIIKINLFY
jgi:serine/threonine protein phosphatase PrpC